MGTEGTFAGRVREVDVILEFAAKIAIGPESPVATVVVFDVMNPNAIVLAHLEIILLSRNTLAVQTFDPELSQFSSVPIVPVHHTYPTLEFFGLGCRIYVPVVAVIVLLLLVRVGRVDDNGREMPGTVAGAGRIWRISELEV